MTNVGQLANWHVRIYLANKRRRENVSPSWENAFAFGGPMDLPLGGTVLLANLANAPSVSCWPWPRASGTLQAAIRRNGEVERERKKEIES